MLVLLVVFMITAPMLTTGLKMDLPQARSATTLKPKPPVVVSVTKEGTFAIDMDEMPFAAILPAVQARMDGDAKRVIQIRADRAATYGTVYQVVDLLVAHGFTHIALVSDPKSREPSAANSAPK
eukprot:gene47800-62271_t